MQQHSHGNEEKLGISNNRKQQKEKEKKKKQKGKRFRSYIDQCHGENSVYKQRKNPRRKK